MRYQLIVFIFITVSSLLAADWKPVTPEQLALKKAKVDPNADAEAIFWEASVQDVSAGNGYLNHIVENYIRIKLYNARAVEKYGNVEIPYFSELKMSISELKARTIKPNGSIVEVNGNSIVDRVIVKSGRTNVKAKSFAMPGLEEGSIIEYQWTELSSEFTPRYVELVMQREIPIWDVTYNVRPFQFSSNEQMRAYPFNCQPSKWEPITDDVRHRGFVRTRLSNVPALVEEPNMPADDDVKAWMLLYYTPTSKDKPAAYWPSLGKQELSEFRRTIKVNNDIKQVALEVVGKEEGPFQKAHLLATYCQTKIKNVNHPSQGVTNEARREFFKNLKDTHNTTDTLKLKMGTPEQILALFYALAEAAGIAPIYVQGGSANMAMFRPDFLDGYLLRNRMIAVKSGEDYRYYNPGIPHLPPGMLDWDEQGQPALMAEGKEPRLVLLPTTSSDLSSIQRVADLKLSENGTVSGHVKMSHFGHLAIAERRRMEGQSEGSREDGFKKRLEDRYPGAKITNVKLDTSPLPFGPIHLEYDIELEGYAQRTGKRMFFETAFFNYGEKPRFTSPTRQYPITFRHAFSEHDEIRIQYPITFTLDNAEMPGTLNLGKVGTFNMTAAVSNNSPVISIDRKFVWGLEGGLYFEPKFYTPIKQVWDAIHASNTHTLTLKVK